MTQTGTQRVTTYIVAAMIGIAFGSILWFSATLAASDEEPPDVPSTGSGRVVGKLGAPCALVDEALLRRLYGEGKARAVETADADTITECEWTASPTSVQIHAGLEGYPEREVGNADAVYESDLTRAEEADPAGGLPEKVTDLGDEAYVVYDPKTGRHPSERETTVVKARRGNVVVTVTVRRAPKSGVVGHDRMVEEARQVAAAAVARLP